MDLSRHSQLGQKKGGNSSAVRDQLRSVLQIQTTERAFAGILEDGSVVTWGEPDCGGDSSAVQDQLESVQNIQAASMAFAAILKDGSVVTWGNQGCGGDSSAIQDRLRCVQQLQATSSTFAAMQMSPLYRGAVQALAVTALLSKVSLPPCRFQRC